LDITNAETPTQHTTPITIPAIAPPLRPLSEGTGVGVGEGPGEPIPGYVLKGPVTAIFYKYILKMKTQDVVLVLLVVIIVILLVRKVVSTYAAADTQAFMTGFLDYAGGGGPSAAADLQKVVNFYVASLTDQPLLPIVNGILSSAPSNVAQPLVPYTSESQLSTMFDNASKNGESGLTFTDRYLLRFLTVMFIAMIPSVQSMIGTITWDAQGKPNIANDVLQNNQSIQDNMKVIFQLVQSEQGGQVTQDVITKFNSILPSNLTPFASLQDYQTRGASLHNGGTPDPSMVFLYKYIMVGPAYLAWVAENKYKLDPAFKCFN
jgi:hypothetical protein